MKAPSPCRSHRPGASASGWIGKRCGWRTDDPRNIFAERIEAQLNAKDEEHGALRRRVLMLEAGHAELGNYTSEVERFGALEAES